MGELDEEAGGGIDENCRTFIACYGWPVGDQLSVSQSFSTTLFVGCVENYVITHNFRLESSSQILTSSV
jgi:hypothetical protein